MLETKVSLLSQPEPPVGEGKEGMWHYTVFLTQEERSAAEI